MLDPSLPWWEFVLRAAAVYAFVMTALRLAGKRQIGQMTPSDLVVLLLLSDAVQNSMNGGDDSLTGGLITASVLLVLSTAVAWIASRNRRVERVIEGEPEILVHNGRVFEAALARAFMSRNDLARLLRRSDAEQLSDVQYAILETDGNVSVKLRDTQQEQPSGPLSEPSSADADASLWHLVERVAREKNPSASQTRRQP